MAFWQKSVVEIRQKELQEQLQALRSRMSDTRMVASELDSRLNWWSHGYSPQQHQVLSRSQDEITGAPAFLEEVEKIFARDIYTVLAQGPISRQIKSKEKRIAKRQADRYWSDEAAAIHYPDGRSVEFPSLATEKAELQDLKAIEELFEDESALDEELFEDESALDMLDTMKGTITEQFALVQAKYDSLARLLKLADDTESLKEHYDHEDQELEEITDRAERKNKFIDQVYFS
jgi:hypothetical protein